MEHFLNEANLLTGFTFSSHQKKAFEIYERELIAWNEKINLTAIRDVENIRIKHFLDSLSCLLAMKNPRHERVIDIGTGAGFPGIPLKIACPGLNLTLVESVGKKANFCRHVVDTLRLENVEILNLRAEEVGRLSVYREKYDWALARAVASLPILSEYLLPLLKIGGSMLAQKGESAHAEAQLSEKALKQLGGELDQILKVTLPGVVEERFLVVIRKKSATPPVYPRNIGVPSKKPL